MSSSTPSFVTPRYVIDASDVIVDVNDDWDSFARENNSSHLTREHVVGTRIWDYVTGEESQQLYKAMFRRVRESRSAAKVQFRCDSPEKRRFLELVIECAKGSCLKLTSLTLSEEARPYSAVLDPVVPRSDVFVVICAWCKRIRLDDSWVEVEDAVRRLKLFEGPMPRLSQGICGPCSADFRARRP